MSNELYPNQVASLIRASASHLMHRTLMITSSPGLGKTQICQQQSAALEKVTGKPYGFMAVHAPTISPESIAIPLPNKEGTKFKFVTPDDSLPFEQSDGPDHGILLIDELPQGSKDTQKMLANLIQDRNVYGSKIKDGWTIVCTGNRQEDRAGAGEILSHLNDRMTEIKMIANLDDWQKWFRASPHFCVEGSAFLAWRPELLSAFDPNHTNNPTPRSWTEGVFARLGKIDPSLELAVFEGDVGQGAASEFVGFLRTFRHLPDVKAVLAKPLSHPVPDKPDVRYALSALLASKADEKNFEAVIQFTERMGRDLQVVCVRGALARNEELAMTDAFGEWCDDAQEDLYAE